MNTKSEEYRFKQRDREKDILAASALWDEIPGDICGECGIGCTIAGERVEGIMTPYDYGVVVKMTLPVTAERYYNQIRSFFNQRPRIPMLDLDTHTATVRCVEKAREMLIELYSDIVWLRMRSGQIREQYGRYLQDRRENELREQDRVAAEKAIIRELSARSGELKRMFKKGLLSQNDYVERRRPIHEEIVNHLRKASVRDAFEEYFVNEYAGCFYLHNIREVLTLIAEGGL